MEPQRQRDCGAMDEANQDRVEQMEDQGEIRKAVDQDGAKLLENQYNATGLEGQGEDRRSAD